MSVPLDLVRNLLWSCGYVWVSGEAQLQGVDRAGYRVDDFWWLWMRRLRISKELYRLGDGKFFFCKGSENISDFEGHIASVTASQRCSFSAKAAVDGISTNGWICTLQNYILHVLINCKFCCI